MSSGDITSHDFWSRPFTVRDERFAQLRAGDGLSWHRPMPSLFPMEEPGFWALELLGDLTASNAYRPTSANLPQIGVTMRVEVDLDKCTGHGICESIADDVFEVQDDGTVRIDENERPESDRDRMQQAVTHCPAAALRLVD